MSGSVLCGAGCLFVGVFMCLCVVVRAPALKSLFAQMREEMGCCSQHAAWVVYIDDQQTLGAHGAREGVSGRCMRVFLSLFFLESDR